MVVKESDAAVNGIVPSGARHDAQAAEMADEEIPRREHQGIEGEKRPVRLTEHIGIYCMLAMAAPGESGMAGKSHGERLARRYRHRVFKSNHL